MTYKPQFLILVLASLASASTIQFVGAPTGVNDGSYYVLPYEVTIDGQLMDVTCYDLLDNVSPGDTWQASVLDLADAAASGFFPGGSVATYERIAWLSAQTYANAAEEIGLQYAIWGVFDPSAPVSADATAYDSAADTAAAGGYTGFDFSAYRFIQQSGVTAGSPGIYQAFVFDPPPGTVPEPETTTLAGAGLLSLGAAMALRSVRKRRHFTGSIFKTAPSSSSVNK